MSKLTQNEEHLVLIRQYRESGQPWPATSQDMAKWMIHRGLMKPHPNAFINQCAELLSTAMREEYYTDPQGRRVRAKLVAKHNVNGKQLRLWDDHRTAPLKHHQISSQMRRQNILGECRQLNIDETSYNENAKPETTLQTNFDFRQDLIELEIFESLIAGKRRDKQPSEVA